ncbi:DUF444 family protein [Alicyclobacillus macrosporangiidus]|uniref:DUF444 family protein n=1 Tax=Alicyclobacillus macrosporangiidus TaxID=392015 RepID=UPI00068A194F|nr:DUF444 family protein [Alicyclobacillus macrosporangiidus]
MSVVTHDDWSLDRRGQSAQARHREKIKQAIRENLADLVSDQGIILSDGKRTVRIPVPTLDEPHFRFDYNKQQHVGQGEGKPGQSIGRVGGLGQGPAARAARGRAQAHRARAISRGSRSSRRRCPSRTSRTRCSRTCGCPT